MNKVIIMCLVVVLNGCDGGGNEPSIFEIEDGFVVSFSRETGIPKSCMNVSALKKGSGQWSIRMILTRSDGQQHTLNATATMDKNGDIHYYTD